MINNDVLLFMSNMQNATYKTLPASYLPHDRNTTATSNNDIASDYIIVTSATA